MAVCREWKQGEHVQGVAKAQEAKESVQVAVKVLECVLAPHLRLCGSQWPSVALSGPNGLGLGLGATHFNGTSYLDLPLSCYVPFILCSSFILPFVVVPLLFLCALT